MQVTDPKNAPKWDCFAAHRLSIRHAGDEASSLARDSWHRFSAKKKSHGWCEFAPVTTILDPRQGFQVGPSSCCWGEASLLMDQCCSSCALMTGWLHVLCRESCSK